MLANISPLPISQDYQSTGKGDLPSTGEPSLMSLATNLHNRPIQRYRHMGNNGIVVWATTISAYDKQRQRDITNNGAGICALRHTTVSAYDRMLVCALPHKTASTYGFMLLCA